MPGLNRNENLLVETGHKLQGGTLYDTLRDTLLDPSYFVVPTSHQSPELKLIIT